MSTAPLPASPAPSPTLDKQHISLPSPCTGKERLAASAVAPKAATAADHSLLTPRLEAILASYSSDGHGDAELLKLLLQAKAKEDERLAALDALRAEQLRAANTVAMYSYYAQMSQVAALQQQQQQQQRQHMSALPTGMVKPMQQPYQPLSPPCESSHSAFGGPSAPSSVASGKRSRQSSESADDTAMPAPASRTSSKKSRTSSAAASPKGTELSERSMSPPASAQAATGRVSRADVMAALRRKCEANQQAKQQVAAAAGRPGAPRAIAPKPSASSSRASSVASNDAPSPDDAAAQSMPAPRQRRRSSPQQAPTVGRHTAFLRTAAAPEDAPALPIAPAPATVTAPVTEPVSPVEKVEPPVTAPRNKLALLLHASESSAMHMSPNWHPSAIAAMSDVRGSSQVA